eukprot:3721909-Rhodomonas_salina.2
MEGTRPLSSYAPNTPSQLPMRRYAVYGTDLAYAPSSVCACYAMSGTELPYGATRLRSSLPSAP